ncbi:MAG: SDR family oxidoreductase [Pseudomonadota bacterium]
MQSPSRGIALITGGSRGIGAATAVTLASQGYATVLTFLSNQSAADETVAEIKSAGGRATKIKADVSCEDDMLRVFAEIDGMDAPLTALINNAGIVEKSASVADMSYERIERMMRINVLGSFVCAREAVNRMQLSKGGDGGVIVNLSSAAARLGSPNQYVDYAASKAAIDIFTKGLALEVANDGIRVNAVRPGIIDTEIHASGGIPDRVEQLKETIPMRRGGTAQEVADAIAYLVSDASSYITGTTLDVSGGR